MYYTKSNEKEKVKIMAKFCSKCGNPLIAGQPCSCQMQNVQQPAAENYGNSWQNGNYTEPQSSWQESNYAEPQNSYQQPVQPQFRQPEPQRYFTPQPEMQQPKKEGVTIRLPKIRKPTWDFSSWRNFVASSKDNMGIGDPEANRGKCYEDNCKIVPDNLRPNDGEIPIRQYKFAVLRTRMMFMKAKGRLQITNKRLIFRAPGRSLAGRTLFQNEFDVMEIHGLRLQRGYRFSWWNLIVHGALLSAAAVFLGGLFMMSKAAMIIGTILFSLLGLGSFFALQRVFPLKWILNQAAAFLYLSLSMFGATGFMLFMAFLHAILMVISIALHCCQKDMKFMVDTSSGTPSIIIDRERGGGLLGLFGRFGREDQQGTGYREVQPDVDTERAVRELNAIISDLQTMGDLAVDKWKEE